MKLHRFYVEGIADKNGPLELTRHLWVQDKRLVNQWLRVLRFRPGDELVLFNGQADKLYKITKVEEFALELQMVTELEPKLPKVRVYLFWSLLKQDKNEWVIQKCTELGVTNFIPLTSERTVSTGFKLQRAVAIAIEAAEQCGRSDIPHIREPISLVEAIEEYSSKIDLFICDKSDTQFKNPTSDYGVMVGPEGGWSEHEHQLFNDKKLNFLDLHDNTLRAETASIVAVTKLLST